MGKPMSSNLASKGFDVVLYDVDQATAKQVASEIGVGCATSLKVLGEAVDVVVTMLPTGQIVREVMLGRGNDGLATFMKAGSLLIDMSSSDPLATRELGAELAQRGIAFVDAPVSGAVTGARAATLAIMVGGDDPAAIDRAKPILAAMGNRLFETGKLGSGHAMKALNNYVAAAAFAASSEALIAGEKFGLDPATIVDILNASTGRNFNTENVMKPQVVEGRHGTGFRLALMSKDVKIAADLARGLSLDLPISALVSQRWIDALDELGTAVDFSSAYKSWKASASGGKAAG
jgi:3-hydroxyisobutyrate dehydrogenase